MNIIFLTLLIGIGATAVMDLWALIRKRVFGIAAPNYSFVGRWVLHMKHGCFRHKSIATSPSIRGERIFGWGVHYLIGVIFAALLIAISGSHWLERPTLLPAFLVGLGTVVAPFLLMQPGMGAGIAASKTPNPAAARLQSLINHGVFGFGLFVSGWAVKIPLQF